MIARTFSIVLFLTISIPFRTVGQEVFSDAFVGEDPIDLVAADGFLYAATANTFSINRIAFNDPDGPSVVASPWLNFLTAMAYDSDDNIIYASNGSGVYGTVDLSLPLPISPGPLTAQTPAQSMFVEGDNLYYCDTDGNIRFIDLTTPDLLPQGVFDDSFGRPKYIAKRGNLIYYIATPDGGGNDSFRRINISGSSPVEEILIFDLGGVAFAGKQVENYFYVGLQGGDNDVLRFDLSDASPIPDVFVSLETDYARGITYNEGFIYISLETSDLIVRVAEPLLNIDEQANKPLSIYPNPTSSTVFIEAENSLLGSDFKLYSIIGSEVLTGTLNADQSIDLSDLPSGVYVLTINAEGTSKNFRVVKR